MQMVSAWLTAEILNHCHYRYHYHCHGHCHYQDTCRYLLPHSYHHIYLQAHCLHHYQDIHPLEKNVYCLYIFYCYLVLKHRYNNFVTSDIQWIFSCAVFRYFFNAFFVRVVLTVLTLHTLLEQTFQ